MQLAWRLRALIASGRLGPGDRLPGVRELASGAAVNVNTARAVYSRLEDEGLIASRHGRGTFVAEDVEASPELERLAAEATDAARAAGADPRELARVIYAGTVPESLETDDPMAGASQAPSAEQLEELVDTGTERPAGAAARRELRRQIARLEAELAPYPESRPSGEPTHPLLRPKGHVADVGELEAIRDELLERLKRARSAAAGRGEREGRARQRLDEMVENPGTHRWESVSHEELGEPGCTTYSVEPKWGPVGALMNWWRIKVSGGCPLAGPLLAVG